MRISLNWIKQFTHVPEKYSAKELANLLTLRTCEVEGWEDQGEKLNRVVVGKIKKIKPHPNADKLKLCDTDIGDTVVQIVCGGSNVAEGLLVPVALPGAKVDWHGAGEVMELQETKIRGEKSYGMICAGEEIGIGKCPVGEITDLTPALKDLDGLEVKPGTALAPVLRLNDIIFEIDNKSITHRPDLWGHYGMAREFAGFLSQQLKDYAKTVGIEKLSFPRRGGAVKVTVESAKISPRFCCVIATNVKIEDSPEWMKAQLLVCGVRPVNNVVDITNFVMLELGQPMHAFDRKLVGTDMLEVRYAKHGEVLETLDHKKRALNKDDAIISNGETILSLAGIMGGLNSEISNNTTEIIFEAANWNPVMIRKTSQRMGLRSDASQRFEKSLDPALCDLALKRACALLKELCPQANISYPLTDIKLASPKKITVTLSVSRVCQKIGVELNGKDIASYLKKLGFAAKEATKGTVSVTIPSHRATKDISIEDDLIEEVARMYGYEKIPPQLPELPMKLPMENRERLLQHKTRDIFSLALEFTEVSYHSFYNKKAFEACRLPEAPHFTITNPLSEDQTHLRVSLLPNLLKGVANNERMHPEQMVYEIGRRYIKQEGSYFPLEETFICGAVLNAKPKQDIFFAAKGAVESFLKAFPVPNAIFEESTDVPPYVHPQKSADIFIRGKEKTKLGTVATLHPVVKANFGIRGEVAVFSLNFSLLANLPPYEKTYQPIPKFPGIDLDVSFIAPKKTRNADIETLIKKLDAALIQTVRLIDTFEGGSLEKDKKSFTYRVHLLSPDRTLTDSDMHSAQDKIFNALSQKGYAVRK